MPPLPNLQYVQLKLHTFGPLQMGSTPRLQPDSPDFTPYTDLIKLPSMVGHPPAGPRLQMNPLIKPS